VQLKLVAVSKYLPLGHFLHAVNPVKAADVSSHVYCPNAQK
jgi:hypothetical protein